MRHADHPSAGGGDGVLFRNPGLVYAQCVGALRRAEAAAEPGLCHGHAPAAADSGRADQPAGSDCRLGFSGDGAEDQPGHRNDHSAYRTPVGGCYTVGGQPSGYGQRAHDRNGNPIGDRTVPSRYGTRHVSLHADADADLRRGDGAGAESARTYVSADGQRGTQMDAGVAGRGSGADRTAARGRGGRQRKKWETPKSVCGRNKPGRDFGGLRGKRKRSFGSRGNTGTCG